MKKTKNKVQGAIAKYDNPGRPRYEMVFPKSLTFTPKELMGVNGVDIRKHLPNGHVNKDEGKGPNCAKLTINNNLKHAIAKGEVFPLTGYKAVTLLGRHPNLFRHKSTPFSAALVEAKARNAGNKVSRAKVILKPRKAKAPKTPVAKLIENAKAILAEPIAVVIIAPAAVPVIPIVETPVLAPAIEIPLVNKDFEPVSESNEAGVTTTCEA